MYRSDQAALRMRLDALGGELSAADEQQRQLARELARQRSRLSRARSRLRERRTIYDRSGGAALAMVVVGLAIAPAHLFWHHHVLREVSVIPAILSLGLPGLIAAIIAWPGRRVSRACAVGLSIAIVLCLLPLVSLAYAWGSG